MLTRKQSVVNHFLVALFVAVIIFGAFSFYILWKSDWMIDSLILAGDKFADRELLNDKIAIIPDSYGYDGQFYYRLAIDPLADVQTLHGITLDMPALRHQRIVYPVIAKIASFNNQKFIPASLFLVNLAMLIGIVAVAARICEIYKQSPYYGLLFGLYPGFLFTLTRDLTEICATFFSLSAVYLLMKNRYCTAAVLFSVAVLSKETSLIYVFGVIIWKSWQYFKFHAKPSQDYLLVAILPIFTFVGWQGVLYKIWGQVALMDDSIVNMGAPLTGLIRGISGWDALTTHNYYGLALLIIVLASGLFLLNKSRITGYAKIFFLLSAGVMILWSNNLWVEDVTFLRAGTELYISFCMILAGASARYLKAWTVFLAIFLGKFAHQRIYS